MSNSNALAAETRFVVSTFLSRWVDASLLTYKFSVHAETSRQNRHKVQVAFSKPTPEMPAPLAVAHFCFHLDETLQHVKGFTVESDPHFHALDDIRFDERVIDQVIKRKLLLKQQNLVNLNDEFSSTRVPSAIKAREEEKRARDRENFEEYLLETFQRKDPYNDGRIPFSDFRVALLDLDLPGVSQQQQQILFAFAEQDRDETVDYAAFVSIAADVVDTLTHVNNYLSESKADAKDASDWMQEAEEAYHVVVAREIDYTIQKLNKLIQNQDQQTESAPATEESRDAAAAATVASSGSTISLEPTDEQKTVANEEAQTLGPGSDAPGEEVSHEKPSIYITPRQLRGVLESPQLLISEGEINLILGLAEVSPSGKILSSQLGELYPRVRSLIFQYQHQCFGDRLENYLLQQFTSYERSNLQGSTEHLRFKLKQKEIMIVVKDMKKLLLAPYQVMQVLSIGETSRDAGCVVSYKDCIPRITRFLQDQADLDNVINRAAMLHSAQESELSTPRVFSVPSEDVLKRSSLECFEQLDQRKLGVLPTADFYTSLGKISQTHGMTLDEKTEMWQLNVLADPAGSGRVNYLYFIHFMYPLLRFLQQERLIRYGKESKRRQDAKLRDDEDSQSKDLKN